MKRSKIIQILKELQKITCGDCKQLEQCYKCKIYILTNNIMEELNGK